MTTALEIPYPTFARIYPEQQCQLAAWSQQFEIAENELYTLLKIAGPVEKDVYDYLQTLRPMPVRSITYSQLLSRFQTFVDTAVQAYLDDYRRYTGAGGNDSFYKRCWGLLLSEVVEEAANLANDYSERFNNEGLLLDLRRISEGHLLVLDRVLA
jgi:hypothetical protein